jgi:hypothetical protein
MVRLYNLDARVSCDGGRAPIQAGPVFFLLFTGVRRLASHKPGEPGTCSRIPAKTRMGAASLGIGAKKPGAVSGPGIMCNFGSCMIHTPITLRSQAKSHG